ncbi:MAG TPA: hypothetical protein VFS05_00500 [Gemmatimonadaceae bacterium]|nr:hypothetical protein [Gemmatimonadaceae bacterium]
MRKAVQLVVTLVIEGEDEPAHDFAASCARAVRHILATGARGHPELTIRVKRIVERSDD